MKTEQVGSEQKPGPFEDVLAVILKCPDCNTQRSFKVTDGFGTVITRQSSGWEINSWCEKCGRRISMQLVWTRRHKGWTVEKVILERAVHVQDEFGLSLQKGEKLV